MRHPQPPVPAGFIPFEHAAAALAFASDELSVGRPVVLMPAAAGGRVYAVRLDAHFSPPLVHDVSLADTAPAELEPLAVRRHRLIRRLSRKSQPE